MMMAVGAFYWGEGIPAGKPQDTMIDGGRGVSLGCYEHPKVLSNDWRVFSSCISTSLGFEP